MSMNDALSVQIWARQIANIAGGPAVFASFLPFVPPVEQRQGPPTMLQMIVGIIEDGVSGYDYEMDAEEIATKILALIGK